METSKQILSKATGIQAYNPTLRERSTRTVANLLRDKFGMDNYKAFELARDIFGDENSPTILGSLGIADFTPAGAFFGGQEGARMYRRSDDLVGKGMGAGIVGLSAIEGLGPLGLAIKAGKKVLPKNTVSNDPDLKRRSIIKGLAAVPVAGSAIAKGIADLPMGAASKVAKAVPPMTGSKILDNLPFVKNQLAPVFSNIVSNKSVIDFEASYDPLPPTPGGIPRPRQMKVLKEVQPDDRVFQALFHLDEIKTTLETIKSGRLGRSEDGSPIRNLRDIDTTNMRTPLGVDEKEVIADVSETIGFNILADFVDANRNLSLDEAITLLDKEGFDLFKKTYQSGELDNSQFLQSIEFTQDRFKNKTEYKKFLDDYFKNKPSGTIENIRDDILGEDAGGYVLEEQGDIMYDMAEELYLPNEKLRRAFQDGQMSLEDFNRMYVEK